MTLELYSTPNCGLCSEAHQLLLRLRKEFRFEVKEVHLVESHPLYREYLIQVPVIHLDGRKVLAGNIEESRLREILVRHRPRTPAFFAAKALEALGFLTVAVGLMYGLLGSMWLDLYFFLAGIVVFSGGRILEKRVTKELGSTNAER